MNPDTERTDLQSLDLRGLKCPLPALMARRALRSLGPGAKITVLTDDPMAPIDIPHLCRDDGVEVLAVERQGDAATIVLRNPQTRAANGKDI